MSPVLSKIGRDEWVRAVDMEGSIAAMIYSAPKLKEVRNNLYYVLLCMRRIKKALA